MRDAVAQRRADVGHRAGDDVESTDAEAWSAPPGRRSAGELVQRDREQRRADRRAQHAGRRAAVLLRRRIDDEFAFLAQQRGEERQTLDVIPVQVAQQTGAAKRRALGPRQPEVAQSGAEVEQQRVLAVDGDRHTGRVPAVSSELVTLARRRPAHSVERHLHVTHTPDHRKGRASSPWCKRAATVTCVACHYGPSSRDPRRRRQIPRSPMVSSSSSRRSARRAAPSCRCSLGWPSRDHSRSTRRTIRTSPPGWAPRHDARPRPELAPRHRDRTDPAPRRRRPGDRPHRRLVPRPSGSVSPASTGSAPSCRRCGPAAAR